MAQKNMMNLDQAKRIAQLDSSDITAILTLSTFSHNEEDIIRIARKIRAEDTAANVNQTNTQQPRPLYIIAPSFVKDKNQYNRTYGLSDEAANELTGLLYLDPEAACEKIEGIVRAKLDGKGQRRDIRVRMNHHTSTKPRPVGNLVLEENVVPKQLSAEIAKNPNVYGQYQFEPMPTGLATHDQYGIQYQYGVHLGDDLFAIGQSKKMATSVARICRVKGRFDNLVRQHICYWVWWLPLLRGDEIPTSIWDGKQSSVEPIKPRKTYKSEELRSKKRTFDESELVAEDVD